MIGEQSSLASVSALSPKKQLAFALLVFGRMLPCLTAFSKDTNFDDSCYLRAKEAAWMSLQGGAVDQTLHNICVGSAPDTERFSHELTSYALNAALAISEILRFTLDGHVDHVARVLTLARDSADLYLSTLDLSLLSSWEEDDRIAGHLLVQEEQHREEEDVKFLSELPDQFDNDAVSILRERGRQQAPLLPLGG